MLSCCVIGHRRVEISEQLKNNIKEIIYNLINKGVSKFLFGSKSEFVDLCNEIVIDIQKEFPNVQRIYVRAEYPIISEEYYKYLKTLYDDSYYYDSKKISGKLSYIKRNEFLVRVSDYCLFYYKDSYQPNTKTKSGARLAYDYATKKRKAIINVC